MEDQIFGFNVPKPESQKRAMRMKPGQTLDMVQLAKDILGVEGESAPYPWCRGNPTVKDCIRLGYCAKDPNCGE
jgi:hypothetical protein